MSGSNNIIQQGTLNRLLTNITVASYPALNVTSGYFSKAFSRPSIAGPYTTQIPTGTGIVNSPEPYVMGDFVINLLRTQALSGAWLTQVQLYSVLGTVTGYSDTTTFPSIQLANASVTALDPGAWDGTDPVVSVTVTGVYFINSNLWSA